MTQKKNGKKCEGCGMEDCQNCSQGNGCENCIPKPVNLPKNVIESQQFSKEAIEYIFAVAEKMEKSPPKNLLADLIMLTLFYEPSTRTRLSFEMAMKILGGKVISTENAREFSSAAKGETLSDTIRTICGYRPDAIVLRHFQEDSSKIAQEHSSVPIINAGDGPGQHPTQALLDLYTIKKQFGEIKGLKIALIGDLINSRTVRSLCYNLGEHYPDNFIYLVSLEETRMKNDIKAHLDEHGVGWKETCELEPILNEVDIFYQTRVQRERFKNIKLINKFKSNYTEKFNKLNLMQKLTVPALTLSGHIGEKLSGYNAVYEKVKKESKKLIINAESLKKMKKDACIMHPLPRGPEIATDVDNDKRAIYFQQAENGLYIRMALLKMLLLDNKN